MKNKFFYFSIISLVFVLSILGKESQCPKKPDEVIEKNINTISQVELDKYVHEWYEWSYCDEYERQQRVKREKIILGKKRRIILKEFDFAIKNIPKETEVYFTTEKRRLGFSCLQKQYYLILNGQPYLIFSCTPNLDRPPRWDLGEFVGIEDKTTKTVNLGPKDGKYFRDVYGWSASSYKTKDFTCNAICTALVDFEYKDWFLKNVYFRVE